MKREDVLSDRVSRGLDKIRPYIEMDGGKVALAGIDEKRGVVSVFLKGACHGCPGAQATLKGGIERAVKAEAPEIKEVVLAN